MTNLQRTRAESALHGQFQGDRTQLAAPPDFDPPQLQIPMSHRPDAPAWMRLQAFADLPDTAMERILAVAEARKYLSGQRLMTQGEPGDGLIVLREGSVLVTVEGDVGEYFERSINAPAILGEGSVLTGEARSATVSAVTTCDALFLDAETMRHLCTRFPATAAFLTTLVGERLMASDSIRRVGKYEVLGRLGTGGVATVFAAVHPELGRSVALKMLSHALIFDRTFAAHFADEARLVAQLDHEHIVRVFDTERAYGTQFIVMERLLGSELRPPAPGDPMLSWATLRRMLVEILDALAYSHQCGLVHRDIKPSNVFLTREGKVKLLDFGIAVDLGTSAEREGRIIGTPAYMSPEQASGFRLDGQSDLYSTAILAYELCTGQLPFPHARTGDAQMRAHIGAEFPDPRALVPDIPDDLREFILVATRKHPQDRFASCGAAREFLRAADTEPGDSHAVATLGLSFPLSAEVDVHAILSEAAEKLRAIRGVQLASGFDRVIAPVGRTTLEPRPQSEQTRLTQRRNGLTR